MRGRSGGVWWLVGSSQLSFLQLLKCTEEEDPVEEGGGGVGLGSGLAAGGAHRGGRPSGGGGWRRSRCST